MTVGIVIVSHSAQLAEAAAYLVVGMGSTAVRIAHCSGQGGGVGIAAIGRAIDSVWSEDGVAVLYDFGSSHIHAIEAARSRRMVAICDAPIVEGAMVAVLEAANGSDLAAVVRAAEEAR